MRSSCSLHISELVIQFTVADSVVERDLASV